MTGRVAVSKWRSQREQELRGGRERGKGYEHNVWTEYSGTSEQGTLWG